MLKDLQKMQSKMLKAQSDLKAQSFDAEAGGGMVKVAMNGKGILTLSRSTPMPSTRTMSKLSKTSSWQPSTPPSRKKTKPPSRAFPTSRAA